MIDTLLYSASAHFPKRYTRRSFPKLRGRPPDRLPNADTSAAQRSQREKRATGLFRVQVAPRTVHAVLVVPAIEGKLTVAAYTAEISRKSRLASVLLYPGDIGSIARGARV